MMQDPALAGAIDALLPQTQCTRCGFPSCQDYARALAKGRTTLNRCPPGGQEGVRALATLLGQPELPLDPALGAPGTPARAFIDEPWCIGCTLCIQACPVDAISGAARHVHTVLLEQCTGCGLCLPPCPVDCIQWLDTTELARRGVAPLPAVTQMADASRQRHAARQTRLQRQAADTRERLEARAMAKAAALESVAPGPDLARKRAVVEAALARARARRSGGQP